jgi:antirestriction protein
VIDAYVTNLGKYNEGELCGEWLKLPAPKEDVQSIFSQIGVDGVLYEEFFITDYDTDLAGMQNLGEYASLNELNYLASLLSDMSKWDLEIFEAAAVYGDHSGSVHELINLTENLDCYDYFPNVNDNDDLGRYLIEELGCEEIPERLEMYFDYEAYGRDFSINEGGEFVDGGYVLRGYGRFTEIYDGIQVPEEYRIFAFPDPPEKMPIKQQLEMFGKMVTAAGIGDKPPPSREDR